jgi:ADP-ribosylglycohydrolase
MRAHSASDDEIRQQADLRAQDEAMRKRFRGCLVGGAVGDALGAPVEFISHAQIVQEFGQDGIRDYVPAFGKLGAITDDTQMTLFTAEGMLRAYVRGRMRGMSTYAGVTDHAYQRWLQTQGEKSQVKDVSRSGWLWRYKALHSRRAPGLTCLAALKAKRAFGDMADNDSKGCGGVMRVAPVGMFAWHERDRENTAQRYFDVACDLAGLTHGHPTGMLTAGVLAVLVMRLLDGESLGYALREARQILVQRQARYGSGPECGETESAIGEAVKLAGSSVEPGPDQIKKLGQGWVAEEALAISIYCALVAKDFEHGITLAVNHGGDSDSTGAITGNLLGAMLGIDAIPTRWRKPLELARVIQSLADDLYDYPSWNIGEYLLDDDNDNERINARYPGW